jgi:hypothetical protein
VGESKKQWYQLVLGGNLATMGEVEPSYSLGALTAELRGSRSVGDAYIDLLAEYLDIDIYIGDAGTGDVYRRATLNQGYRNSIFLLYRRGSTGVGHFNCLGIARDDGSDIVDTLFSPRHELTQRFYARSLSSSPS